MSEIREDIINLIVFLKKEVKETQWLSDDPDYNSGVESGLWISIDKLESLERNWGDE